jgi:hypothetical protein
MKQAGQRGVNKHHRPFRIKPIDHALMADPQPVTRPALQFGHSRMTSITVVGR